MRKYQVKAISTNKSFPAGMKFNREQGKNFILVFGNFRGNWILKPGGFSFHSSPRLYHRMHSAIDDAGFEIKMLYVALYSKSSQGNGR